MTNSKEKKETINSICVIGLGYVGLTLATVFAEEGANVVGVDLNEKVIGMLKEGKPHFYEPGLSEKISLLGERLLFTTSIADAKDCTAFVIAVGSNVNDKGEPDYSHVEGSSQHISSVLKRGDLVVLRSTVTIGATRKRVIPILEKASGLSAGKDFFVSFAPERTIEGNALEELRTLPQLIAGYTEDCRDRAEQLFSLIAQHIVLLDTLEESELSKLISNAHRDLSFAFANSISLIASEHNVNINTVISAANDGYHRNHIPLPSPGVGGYCLSKDPQLLANGAIKYTTAGNLLREGREVNEMMPAHVADIVDAFKKKHYTKEAPHIVVIGLAFKGSPATSDVRHSPSEILVRELIKRGHTKVSGHDPHVAPEVFERWNIGRLETLDDVSKHGDIVIFMHRNEYYSAYNVALLAKGKNKKLVLDPWGMYNLSRETIISQDHAYANLGYRSF